MSACLLSTAPTKPTGKPMIAAGLAVVSLSISSRRNRLVGALPMTITAPSICCCQSLTAAALRVVCWAAAIDGVSSSFKVQISWLLAGKSRLMMPDLTISQSHNIGAPFCRAVWAAVMKFLEKATSLAMSTMPQE